MMVYSVRRGGRPPIPPDPERCTEDVASAGYRSQRCANPRRPSDDYPTMCGTHAAAKRRVEKNNAARRRRSEWRERRGVLVQQRDALLVEIIRAGVEWSTQIEVRPVDEGVKPGEYVHLPHPASPVMIVDSRTSQMHMRFARYAELQQQIRAIDREYDDVQRTEDDHFNLDRFKIPTGA